MKIFQLLERCLAEKKKSLFIRKLWYAKMLISKETSLLEQVRLKSCGFVIVSDSLNEGTVIHPKANIIGIVGPIVIGSNCILEEGVTFVNRLVHTL